MSKLSRLKQVRQAMGNLFGANGHPLGQAPPILRPGQDPVNLQTIVTPQGPAIIISINGRTTPIDLGDGKAGQLGMALIGLEAQYQLVMRQQDEARRAQAAPTDDLLAEAQKNVGG